MISTSQSRVFSRSIMLIGIWCLATALAGCQGSAAPKASTLPQGNGEVIYRTDANEKGKLTLERVKERAEVSSAPEVSLFEMDVVENVGPQTLSLLGKKSQHQFAIRPGCKIKLGEKSIVLYQGGSILSFRNVDGVFKITLPNATLGIRGTRLEVAVKPDGQSFIRMLEGKIEIEREGKTTPLANQESALLGLPGTPIQLNPPENALPEFLRDLPSSGNENSIQKF